MDKHNGWRSPSWRGPAEGGAEPRLCHPGQVRAVERGSGLGSTVRAHDRTGETVTQQTARRVEEEGEVTGNGGRLEPVDTVDRDGSGNNSREE